MELLRFETILLLLSVGGGWAQDALPHETLYVELGKNITFKTMVDLEKSFVTIVWSFKDDEGVTSIISSVNSAESVGEGYEGRVWLNHTTGQLTMGPVTAADDGEYAVSMLDNTAATQTGETVLHVLVAVSAVKISSSPAEALESNSTVILNCSALGTFLTFSWTNGTAALVGDGKRISITQAEQWSSVTIREVNRWELRGPIGCSVTNKLEKKVDSAPFNMAVHYGPEAVVMTPRPAVATGGFVMKGSNMTLSCAAASSPPAALSWFHDGKPLAGQTGPTLVLSDLSEAQGGAYHCSAHNAKTQRTVAAPATAFTVMEAISGAEVTGPAAGVLAGVVGGVNLTCVAAAGAVARRAWLKDGAALPADGRTALLLNGSLLRLLPLAKEHRGVYSCALSNAVNTATARRTLEVFYGPDGVAVSGEAAVEVNDPVTLTCAVDSSPPAAITWRFNGTARPQTTRVLAIAKAAYRDSGRYTCEAANAKTGRNDSSTFTLSVKEEGTLSEGLSGGAVAGIVIAVLVAVGAAVAGFIYCKRKQTIESPY